jgi:peptide/nickel transport system permease protein
MAMGTRTAFIQSPDTPRTAERSSWREFARRLRANKGALLGLILLGSILVLALFADILAPYSPTEQVLRDALQPPSSKHWFGTDELGRDLFSRTIHGARVSFQIALLVLGLATITGGILGAVAGYYGGLWDEVVMRIADIFFAFPHFLLAMAMVAALGPGLRNAMIAVAIAYWPRYARLLRGTILVIRNNTYVEAARSLGGRDFHIVTTHILPNAIAPVLIQATMDAGVAILTTAGLSFVGLGALPPTPEWGAMVAGGRNYITTSWWIPTFPGLFITLTVAGFMFLGDGLRDILDPALRGRVGF